ncbi:MAG TPA: carboxypeptidase regulatory-like domain-containing protein, partial [Kofleriaceae bacterium]|nr:carboxypeptidase regulatory-like domain-containing protein [Kofleriaceae bacterium]
MMRRWRAVVAVAALSIASGIRFAPDVFAQPASTTGALHGVLHVPVTGEVAGGATIVATSPALQGEQVAIADDHGRYVFASLPSGVYTLTVYYNDRTASHAGVLVQGGRDSVGDLELDLRRSAERIELVIDERLMLDEGSTKTGVMIDRDFTNNVPTGRTFGDVIRVAPGAQLDAYGTSLSGATSVENVYLINGLDTTDTGFGTLSSNLPNEFVQLTEVITGGYGAEYGHSTGGIVNVITKQGSNEFHGTVFGYYTPGSLASTANTIERSGGSIGTHQDLDRAYDVGAEVGGPIVKDKLWFHVGFDPSTQRTTNTRLIQSQVDNVNNATGVAGGDGIPDVDPRTGITLHAPVSSSTIPEARTTYFFTAKVNGALDPNNQFELSVSGNPSIGDADNLHSPTTFAPGDNVFHTSTGAYDASAKYTATRGDGGTRIEAIAGFHRGYSTTTPVNDQERLPLTEYRYLRNLTDFEDLEGAAIAPTLGGNVHDTCNDADPNDPYPKIANCPVADYAEAGLGLLEKRTNDRWSAIVSITQRARMLGQHTFKAGVELDASSYTSDQAFTGGSTLTRSQLD